MLVDEEKMKNDPLYKMLKEKFDAYWKTNSWYIKMTESTEEDRLFLAYTVGYAHGVHYLSEGKVEHE